MRKPTIMKKNIILFTLLLATTSCQETLEQRCARETKEHTRKNCPARLDEFTTQDSLVFEAQGRCIHYYYTLSGPAERGLSNYKIREILLEQLRNNTSLKTYKENGFVFGYTYRAKSTDSIIFTTKLTPDEYRFAPMHDKVGQDSWLPSTHNVSH